MSTPDEIEIRREPPASERLPYVPPAIETERVLEKQLMVICYTIDEACDQDPPQS